MDIDNPDQSRRMFVGGMAGTLLASTAIPASAVMPASAQSSNSESPAAPLPNPTDEYPRPPFPAQKQPWPGLASRMNPRPDHGETSYKGSGRLVVRGKVPKVVLR